MFISTHRPPEKSWIQQKLYEWDPYFRFPSRMISTSVVVLICLYMFITYEIIFYKTLSTIFEVFLEDLAPAFNDSQEPDSLFSALQEFLKVSQGEHEQPQPYQTIQLASWWGGEPSELLEGTALLRARGGGSAVLVKVGLSPWLCCWARNCEERHQRARCLDSHHRYFHADMCHLRAPYLGLLQETHEAVAGWQEAVPYVRLYKSFTFSKCGYFIMHVVQWVVVMILMYVVVLPMIHGQWTELMEKWGMVILTFVLVMLIKRLQVLMAARFFLQPKISPEDKQRPLALDNRKTFQNFTYFLFFYTVVVGLVSCLMRLLRSIAVGAWLIGRIDRTVMPRGYEACDMGFKTWVGMLLMDHYHTNPSLLYFCHILLMKKREKEPQRATYIPGNELRGTAYRVSARARTRWLLLYTLLNNPSLTKLRKPKSWPQTVNFPVKFSV
ncbi:UNVERIFIED_CONTAM: hypothetical protein K2H54_027590 [Gekko kuhli]